MNKQHKPHHQRREDDKPHALHQEPDFVTTTNFATLLDELEPVDREALLRIAESLAKKPTKKNG